MASVPRPAGWTTGRAHARIDSLTRPAARPDPKRSCIAQPASKTDNPALSNEDQEKLTKLKRENERLRKVVQQAAPKLSPQQLNSFAEQYNSIAASARNIGLPIDESLISAIAAALPQLPAQHQPRITASTAVIEGHISTVWTEEHATVAVPPQPAPPAAPEASAAAEEPASDSSSTDSEFTSLDAFNNPSSPAPAERTPTPAAAAPPAPEPTAAVAAAAPAAAAPEAPEAAAPPAAAAPVQAPVADAVPESPAPAPSQPAAAATSDAAPPSPVKLPRYDSEIQYTTSAGKPMRARVATKAEVLTFSFEPLDSDSSSSSAAGGKGQQGAGRSKRASVNAAFISLGNDSSLAADSRADLVPANSDAGHAGGVPLVDAIVFEEGGAYSQQQRGGGGRLGRAAVNAVRIVIDGLESEASVESGDEAGGAATNGKEEAAAPALAAPAAASSPAVPAAEKEKQAARAAARKLVSSQTPVDAVYDKHHWLMVTVPEQPVAGADLVLYFNKNQSETLRNSTRLQLTYGFNKWELAPPEGEGHPDLTPVEGISHEYGADFWSCTVRVPEKAYEVNFVLSDCAGSFDNNAGKDFTLPVAHGITWDEWVDTAAERAAAVAAVQRAEEQARLQEAERLRVEAALKADQDKAWGRANDLRNRYSSLQAGSTPEYDRHGRPLWRVGPTAQSSVAGGKVTLRFNLRASEQLGWLADKQDANLELKYGFSGWKSPAATKFRRAQRKAGDAADQQWWEADVTLPFDAVSMEFVVRGNPGEAYDNNNGGADYKVPVGLPTSIKGASHEERLAAWIATLAERYRQQNFEERTAWEAEARAKEEARAVKRRKAQDLVKQVERRKVRHVLFTEPEVIQAGQEVTIFYNPNAGTLLAGHHPIYVSGSWNRWNHPRKWGPLLMKPPAIGEHYQATVKVPGDAFKMDFVFSDSDKLGEGTYDNRNGFDYNLPVEGSPVKEAPLYVAHIAVEMAPIAKVGGLGDVVTALGRAVKDQGHQVEVILPRYDFFSHSPLLQGRMSLEAEFDWGGCHIYVTTAIVEGLRCFFIEPSNGFFNTGTVYGRHDDEVRFDFFCMASLEFLLRTQRQPDILHCHDWSTARVAKAYWENYNPYGLYKAKVIFTIHNLDFGAKKIAEAAFHCQKFTTVSPTYAYEIGGTPLIAPQTHKFCGIRNGIDPELWDPETSQFLPMSFNSDTVVEGKAAARQALRQRLGMTGWGDKFIVGVISRLTHQKGTTLIKHAQWRTLERGGQFVLLGSAPDPRIQNEYNQLASRTQGENCSFNFKYDEPLSYLIYAAADIILVPSMFEPCGLTQLIAMRYGGVPVVRHTGGLRDTVFDVDFDKARAAWDLYGSSNWERDKIDGTNGFAFGGTDPGSLDSALNRAIDAWYNDRAWFHALQKRVMEQDWSWNRPAIDYVELYYSAIKS